ncbi:unnamed protein product [Dovyalis caffra]|uniref:GS catalytic domain-containing protein n=1 Tax=Dovyalis caffra TaxID=77055 RepID=A0AAV1QXZ2_9ROSI|nr:unnamed protein product [Dovyalis caffra]
MALTPENGIVSANSVKVENGGGGGGGVSLVRLICVDTSGQHRCRVIPEKRFSDVVAKNGVDLTVLIMSLRSLYDAPADESGLGSGTGVIRLMPDLSTRKRIPWLAGEEMVLADMYLGPGEPWEYCPREALRRVSRVLKNEFDLVMNVGFEIEFLLLKKVEREGKEEWVPIDSKPYGSTLGYDAVAPLFHEIVTALHSLNIMVEQIHAEAGKGQFEIVLEYGECTKTADNLIFAHEVIRAVARKHGLLATFVPKFAVDDIGSGSHVHVSLFQNGQNVFMASDGSSRYGMSTIGEDFMAGVLHHLPSILAFTAPIPNSYDRLLPHMFAGAHQCWGRENKEAAIRTACPAGIELGLVSNFELKCFDGCANPYLALAAIIAAGIDGLRKHLPLPEPVDVDPSIVENVARLPQSLSESLEVLKKDKVMDELIGEKLLVAIKAVRKAEIDDHSKSPEASKELIHRLNQLLHLICDGTTNSTLFAESVYKADASDMKHVTFDKKSIGSSIVCPLLLDPPELNTNADSEKIQTEQS